MTFELALFLKATAILLAGLASARLAARARASVRHLILTSTFAALLLLPVVAIVSPALTVEVPASSRLSAIATPAAPAVPDTPAARVLTEPDGEPERSRPSISTVVRVVWGIGALAAFVLLTISLWNLRRIRRSGLPWMPGETSVRALAHASGVRRHLTVILHERIAVPVTCGLMRPAIVLPPDACEWPASDLERAFVHELEHVRRADWWVHLVSRSICALYWFHPLVWIAWRQLGLESERACDDAVVERAEGTDYAEQLVTLAARLSGTEVQPMLSMANRSDLSVRVRAVLDARQLRGRPGVAAAAVTVVVVALLVAAIAPLKAVAVNRHESDQRVARQGPRVDAVTTAINLALLVAAEKGDLTAVTELVNRGADVNAAVDGDGSPLIAAARAGRRQMVQFLLDRGADPNLAVVGDGSPLIAAAAIGNVEILTMLLDRGAAVDLMVESDENALITASGAGHLDAVKFLVSRGANVSARAWAITGRNTSGRRDSKFDHEGEWRTPLNMARRNRHEAVVQFLMSRGAVE